MRAIQTAMAAVVGLTLAVGAEAATFTYTTTLSGAAESPPVASPGTGTSTVVIDTDADTFRIAFAFENLVGLSTVGHIHGPTAEPFTGTAGVITAVPSFPGFPAGVMSGSYDQTFSLLDAATFNPAFIAAQGSLEAAADAFIAALDSGRAYLNIHSDFAPTGEIRGFYEEEAPAPIPLPASLPLLGSALALAFVLRRRRT